ncbi:unnamed protein product [Brassica rapa subsp. trilocularis]
MINIEVLGKTKKERKVFLQLVLLYDQRWCNDRFPCSRLDSDECCHVGWGLAVAALLFFAGSNFYRLQKPGGSPITRMLQVIVALGNYQSTLLVTVVTKVTTTGGRPGWIADNLNRGHLDYYYYIGYWLFLSFLNFVRLPLDC